MANKQAPESFDFPEISDPANPPAGYMRVYANTGAMKQRDSAGTETPLGGGTGDVVGPGAATDNAIARYDGTTGKLLQNSGATVDDSGNIAAVGLSLTNDLPVTEGGTGASTAAGARTNLGALGGSTGATDNALLRADGAGGATAQGSTVTLGDTGAMENALSADVIGLKIKQNATQTANVLEIEDSAGNNQIIFGPDGGATFNVEENAVDFIVNGANGGVLKVSGNGENVGIGTTAASSALLHVDSSSDRGVILVPMTSAEREAVVSPDDNLIVHDTDYGLFMGYNETDDYWYGMGAYAADGVPFLDPTVQSWTTLNGASGTYTEDIDNRRLTALATGNATAQVRGFYATAPSAPYAIRLHVKFWPTQTGATAYAVGFRQNSTGELHLLHCGGTAGDVPFYEIVKWNSATSVNSSYVAAQNMSRAFHWIKLEDDNTNRIISVSDDGVVWTVLHTIGRTDFLTADELFFGLGLFVTTTLNAQASLLSYEAL